MSSREVQRICELCERSQRVGSSPRCATCRQLMNQASNTGATKGRTSIYAAEARDAIKTSVELGASLYPDKGITYACFYSHISLNTDKLCSMQGDYASFDHAVPNDPSK